MQIHFFIHLQNDSLQGLVQEQRFADVASRVRVKTGTFSFQPRLSSAPRAPAPRAPAPRHQARDPGGTRPGNHSFMLGQIIIPLSNGSISKDNQSRLDWIYLHTGARCNRNLAFYNLAISLHLDIAGWPITEECNLLS